MQINSDPRLTPVLGDTAAAHLKGSVEAKHFVEGQPMQVATSHAGLRASPGPDAEQVNQALFGETITVYVRDNGWAWGQLEVDGYVGWMQLAQLTDIVRIPTHRVAAVRSLIFSAANLKSPPLVRLSMGAQVTLGEAANGFRKVEGSGWIWSGHIAPVDEFETDFVSVAERFIGSPYLWGGRESDGIDCSGLVHVAKAACGVRILRDSDMQRASVGERTGEGPDLPPLQRGDLIFWKGHVGIMMDADRLLHANAWHMSTEIEPLADAVARIRPVAGEVIEVRRAG
jgi:cell wall-associated NlpC family hydrolase